MNKRLSQARLDIEKLRGNTLSHEARCERAIDLAELMLEEAIDIQKPSEKRLQKEIARMMEDPKGKAFTTSMTDECFRSNDPAIVADTIIYLLHIYGIPQFLSPIKRLQFKLFKLIGRWLPRVFVPLIKEELRQATSTVILPGEKESLKKHMYKRHQEGIRINLNHLGEAILGEEEAERRLQVYIDDLAKPEVDYISVKISTICSQLNLLAWDDTLSILTERLKRLYRAAKNNQSISPNRKKTTKFVNLDMEEYRDLSLTITAFKQVLEDPEFHTFSAGIVLQAYLPDSFPLQQELTEWAKRRVENGGAWIKIRIVKGANLAMEQVEASLRNWPQAPYMAKEETDANFKRMVIYGSDKKNASAAHLGIGSHNLFDIAYALLLRSENCVEEEVCFEMLEGMADHIRRVVQILSNDMVLYCPAATREEFQNAVAYLIRRLDENTAPENFLRHLFGLYPGSQAWLEQAQIFRKACDKSQIVYSGPRRKQNRFEIPSQLPLCSPFENEPDTDWTLPINRKWAEQIIYSESSHKQEAIPLVIGGKTIFTDSRAIGEDPSFPGKQFYQYSLATLDQIDHALKIAKNHEAAWSSTAVEQRSLLLANIAQALRQHRESLIGAMVSDTGKTIHEGDVEVSEAIDFAEYYRRNGEEIATLADIEWTSKGTILVAPPWNFPCSIPAGGILAALMTGNCVLFKPAPEAVLVGWRLVQVFWEAGVDKNTLQFITCDDEPVGSQLVQDPRLSVVVLTGATSTAKLLLRLRPGLDLMAETGGKNAMIISNLADRDLAVKDLVQSAFGHAGQKCSACSLAICFAEVYDDPHFRKQLRDAAASLRLGSPWDLATRLSPLIHAPNPVLQKGLTELEPGEEWLLKPRQDPKNPNLWSPGIKLGVKPASFTYKNELFGPVLAVMRADNLSHAVSLANGTPYGLTSGLHSLDQREHLYWSQNIEAGNCYINRGITGAIVQRQPFGGCKESSFGPGAKAGGPNYLMQFMHAKQKNFPLYPVDSHAMPRALQLLMKSIENCHFSKENLAVWNSSISSYVYYWRYYFCLDHDPNRILGQDNILRYIPYRQILLRMQSSDSLIDFFRIAAAAMICSTRMEISIDPKQMEEILRNSDCVQHFKDVTLIPETEEQLIIRMNESNEVDRVRLLSKPTPQLELTLANGGYHAYIAPVMANGRLELLHYLREVSLSSDYHRYGNLGIREGENRTPQSSCGGCSCC